MAPIDFPTKTASVNRKYSKVDKRRASTHVLKAQHAVGKIGVGGCLGTSLPIKDMSVNERPKNHNARRRRVTLSITIAFLCIL